MTDTSEATLIQDVRDAIKSLNDALKNANDAGIELALNLDFTPRMKKLVLPTFKISSEG